jgi:hypothetical protein
MINENPATVYIRNANFYQRPSIIIHAAYKSKIYISLLDKRIAIVGDTLTKGFRIYSKSYINVYS